MTLEDKFWFSIMIYTQHTQLREKAKKNKNVILMSVSNLKKGRTPKKKIIIIRGVKRGPIRRRPTFLNHI